MDDKSIVNLYWERNQQAITETDIKYGKYCMSIAKNILEDHLDAEECVNDTYMNAWNSIPPHKPNILSTFLGKVTRNLSFNKYKEKHAKKRGGSEITAVLDELSECVSGHHNVEEEIQYTELVQHINHFLDTLPLQKQNIFVCRYWYADSISDIASQYGLRNNTVSMILTRLRRQLKSYLTERGYHL